MGSHRASLVEGVGDHEERDQAEDQVCLVAMPLARMAIVVARGTHEGAPKSGHHAASEHDDGGPVLEGSVDLPGRAAEPRQREPHRETLAEQGQ